MRVLREASVIAEREVPGDRRVRLYVLEPRALDFLFESIAERSRMWQHQLDAFTD